MKSQIVISGLVIVAMFIVVAQSQDITGLLLNNRLLVTRGINCILGKTPKCDLLSTTIKGLLPAVITDKCKACDSTEKKNAKKLMGFMADKYPNEWKQILELYSANSTILS